MQRSPSDLHVVDRESRIPRAIREACLRGDTRPTLARIWTLTDGGLDPNDALLLALTGRDDMASVIAADQMRSSPPDPAVAHALRTLGLDPAVASALAGILDDCGVNVVAGTHAGSSVAWWSSEINVWTPPVFANAIGSRGIAVCTDGTLSLNGTLPDSVCGSLSGRTVASLCDHPILPVHRVIAAVEQVAGTTTIRLEPEAG